MTMTMTDRAMATVEVIQSLTPIKDADRIELAKIRGWNVVVEKGLYEPGDGVVYCEIDSFLPEDHPMFAGFMDRGVRTDFAGNKGHVVKTIRLRGQYSQGLAIPLKKVVDAGYCSVDVEPGEDVSEQLSVTKWDPPISASLAGEVRGMRPGWIDKTDAERIQNFEDFLPLLPADDYYCTEKIDGTSGSFSLEGDDFHVCSRNLDLKQTEGNTFWEIAERHKIKELLKDLQWGYNADVATIQGEVYGEGINGNRLGVKGHHFAAFKISIPGMVIDNIYEAMSQRPVPVVPLIDLRAPESLSEALEAVDGMKSLISPKRLAEGVVWRRKDAEPIIPGVRAVKVISNKYLLKEK